MTGQRRGRSRELDVMHKLRTDGWITYRLAWGHADVIAWKPGQPPLLVQVKSTAGGPFERFGPAARLALQHEAIAAGADATLAWWPKNGALRYIPASEWPTARRTAA